MKETIDSRPDFMLMKLDNVISYFHLQMPRWLFCNHHYTDMTIEAKVAYTFLLNRFQLSRRNNWVNKNGEVYIIYTREDLACEMQISYRKAIACFKELAQKRLIWEQRRGRGLPNKIFMAEVCLDEKDTYSYDCAPFSPSPRPAKAACLKHTADPLGTAQDSEISTSCPANQQESDDHNISVPEKNADIEMRKTDISDCDNCTSHAVKSAYPDVPKPHTNKKDINQINLKNTDTENSSVSHPHAANNRSPLSEIMQRCALDRFTPEEAAVFRDSIAWLYYCEHLNMGACNYPQSYVRDTLRRLSPDILDYALYKLHHNETEKISNTLVYTAKVLFSSIMEQESDMILDPVINRGRRRFG